MQNLKLWTVILSGLFLFANTGFAQDTVQINHWTHWCSNSDYEKFWEKVAAQFNQERADVDFSIKVTCVPYEGFIAKYTAAFTAKKGPDMFNGMTHSWAGQFKVADPMPKPLAEKLAKGAIPSSLKSGIHDGVRYGFPVEGGNFMMMFINADLFKAAGLDPDRPPRTYAELLAYAKKLTIYKGGKIIQAGYAIRYKGHPLGIADKSAPFFHAWGARWMDERGRKASGYLNSPRAVEALQFYGDLVQKHKVSSVEIDNPAALFGQGLAGIMYRESWYTGWLKKNAPNLNFKVYPLPAKLEESGYSNNFPWAIMVNKDASEKKKKWLWEFFDWYVSNESIRSQHYLAANIIPPFFDLLKDPIYATRPDSDAFGKMIRGRAAPTYYVPPAKEFLFIVGEAILEVMYGKADAKTALDKAAVKADKLLAKY